MTPDFKDSLGVVLENLLVNLRHPNFSIFGTTFFFFGPVAITLFLGKKQGKRDFKTTGEK